ncbi:MAG TPA: DUF1631 domain-containing protein [Gammaproteobacteria bacterium]|nr:DUF1631 domain-containing protein [Gammaproteobacteria bacterium]
MKGGEAGSPDPHASSGVAGAASVLAACREIALGHLARTHQQILHAVDDNLFDLSDRCTTDEERNRFLDGIRLIRLEKDNIESRLGAAFAEFSDACCRPPVEKDTAVEEDDIGEEDLALLNESQLEEALAVSNLAAKLHDCFHDQLFALEQRFIHLLPDAGIDNERIPFGPEALCHALQEAYRPLELDIGLKLYVYKIVDRVLVESLDQLYGELNRHLIQAGILPRLKIRVKKSASTHPAPTPPHGGAPEAEAGTGAASPVPGAMPIQAQMFQALQYLLNAQFDPDAPVDESALSPPVTPLLVDTLSDLQEGLSRGPLAEMEGPARLKEQVHRHYGGRGEGAGRINQIDDETIDVISMIFDYILDDKTLPAFVKAMIARLQIPILKVAIIDRRFFSRKDHPARQLLNELAYAGVGWVEESDAAKDRLYEKMESVIMRVLHEFDSDITIFETLLDDFRRFVEEEKRRFAEAQERIREEAEHRARVRQEATAEMVNRIRDRQLPDEVRDFLMTTWRRVLIQVTLEEGGDSPERQRILQAMDDLVWSLSDEAMGEGRRKLLLILPLMLEALREGMQRLSAGEEEIEAVMDMLGRHHLRRLQPEHDDRRSTAPQPPKEDDIDRLIREMNADIDTLPELSDEDLVLLDEDDRPSRENGAFERLLAEMGVDPEVDSGPRIEDEYTALVRGLELGAWVELETNGATSRLKLAWKGDEFTSFSFMNRQCKVVAELPLYALAEEFRRGRATVIDDVALFDRALDGVISGIMKFKR